MYLPTTTLAMSAGPARPFSTGRSGAGAWTIVSHARQLMRGRIWRITLSRAGTRSSTSVTSSPSFDSLVPPQHGHRSPG